jgi:hypothetical protein
MKTKIISLLAVTITAALISQPMLADITYEYTGNPFTSVSGPYSTSDFVTAMVTLGSPLAANMPLTEVTPLAWSLSDGVQTLTNLNAFPNFFFFATGPTGMITEWRMQVFGEGPGDTIASFNNLPMQDIGATETDEGTVFGAPGTWATGASVPDAGSSSLALLSLSLTALGVAARQFKRAAA